MLRRHRKSHFEEVSVCYKETQWLGMYRQSETRAGNHRRHTRTRNASLPTQANNTARGGRKQPPNQGTIHAAGEDTTHIKPRIAYTCPTTASLCNTKCITPHRVPPLCQAQISHRSTHRGRNRYQPSANTTNIEALGHEEVCTICVVSAVLGLRTRRRHRSAR